MKKLLILLIAGCFGMYGCPDENGDPDPISGCFLKKMTEPWATFQFYYDDEGRLIKVTDTESNGQQVGTWNIGYNGLSGQVQLGKQHWRTIGFANAI